MFYPASRDEHAAVTVLLEIRWARSTNVLAPIGSADQHARTHDILCD
jgi:hypothetical protein